MNVYSSCSHYDDVAVTCTYEGWSVIKTNSQFITQPSYIH